MSLSGQYWEEERKRRERALARLEREKELERELQRKREAETDGFLRRVEKLLTPAKVKRVRFSDANSAPAHHKVIRACADLHAISRAREQGLAPLQTLNRFERMAFARLMKSLIESTPRDLEQEER